MFNPSSDPITTMRELSIVNDTAVANTGYFDPGYLESYGERIVSILPGDADTGYVIVTDGVSYWPTFYQRTHYVNGHGLHNYVERYARYSTASNVRRAIRNGTI